MAKQKTKGGIKVPTLNEIMKRYGHTVNLKAAQITDHGLWLPFSFFALNYLTGGGIPWGKIIEIAGAESSGKTLAALDAAKSAQKLGGHVIWVDAEQAWQNSWAELNGIDLDKITVITDTCVENISDAIADLSIYWRSQLVNNEPILLVVDSIAALDTVDAINAKMVDGKAEMGNRAKAIYKMFRIRNELLYKLGITQIYINQIRTSLKTGFGQDPTTTPGGKALAFYASIRLLFFGGKTLTIKHKSKERKVGKLITLRVIKNKVAPPRTTISKAPAYFNPSFHEVGFDKFFGLDDVFFEEDVITKSNGGVYKYNNETLARGEEKFRQLLETDVKLRRKLLKGAEINTIGITTKKLQDLTVNLFPITEDIDYESQLDVEDDEEEAFDEE